MLKVAQQLENDGAEFKSDLNIILIFSHHSSTLYLHIKFLLIDCVLGFVLNSRNTKFNWDTTSNIRERFRSVRRKLTFVEHLLICQTLF